MNQKAQSTFEYIILVAAVVAVVVAFASSPFFQQSVNEVITNGIDQLAEETEGINFDIPAQSPDIMSPPPIQNDPPPGWVPPVIGSALCQQTVDLIGYAADGTPLFSDPDEYVGNYCAEEIWHSEGPSIYGEIRVDHNGNLIIGTGQGTWVPFNWNNQGHVWSAHQFQRYGPHWVEGCGVGGHHDAFARWFEDIFGREPGCQELNDHYYGHTRVRLEGLTGDLAIYNGMTLMDAHTKWSLLRMFDPTDTEYYIGTPGNPQGAGTFFDLGNWLNIYNNAIRLGVPPPFTLQDICSAFPGEPCP